MNHTAPCCVTIGWNYFFSCPFEINKVFQIDYELYSCTPAVIGSFYKIFWVILVVPGLGATWDFFRVASIQIFLKAEVWKKLGVISKHPTLKNSQVAPYKKLSRFYWSQITFQEGNIICLEWNDINWGTFWCTKETYNLFENVFLCKPDWWFTE